MGSVPTYEGRQRLLAARERFGDEDVAAAHDDDVEEEED